VRDLGALGYLQRKKDRGILLEAVKEPSEITFKNRAANLATIKVARHVISSNPSFSYLEVATAVAEEFDKNWNTDATMRRNGNELIRWVLWLEPFLLDPDSSSDAYSMVSRALGEQKPLGGMRKIFGEKEKRLEELIEQGVPLKEIAQELDLVVGSIYNWKARKRKQEEASDKSD